MPEQRLIERRSYRDFSARVHASRAVTKAQLELTYRCNLHCAHCYTDPYNDARFFERELSTAELLRIVDELADYGVLWLNFSGGEALLRPDFFTLYDRAWERGMMLVLYTNGTTLTPRVLERLKARPPFFIDVSVHSVDDAAFDRFTAVPGSLAKLKAGLAALAASGLPFRVKTKAMTWNAGELSEVRAYVQSLGKEFGFTTSLSPRLDGDLSPLALRPSPAEIAALETLHGVWSEEDSACETALGAVRAPSDALYRCGCGTDSVHVSAWGELGTCALEYEARASLREMSVREAVEKVFNRVRALRYETGSPCRSCEVHAFCDKSPTRARRETGDAEAPLPHSCDVAVSRAERLTRRKVTHPLGR